MTEDEIAALCGGEKAAARLDQSAEIERLTELLTEEVSRQYELNLENERLRAVLTWYASAQVNTMHPNHPGHCDDGYQARRALEGKE